MGADFIGMAVTVAESRYGACTKTDLVNFLNPDEVVRRLLDGNAFLREEVNNSAMWVDADPDDEEAEEATALQVARDVLLEGWETLMHPRYHNYFTLGRGLSLVTGGGVSWGDEPYDGFSQESVLVETALTDSELGALTGIVAGVPETDFIESWLHADTTEEN
jgi:hypothetical protein